VLTTPQVSRRSGRTRPSQNDILLKASRITTPEPLAANHGVAAMILKLATNDKASIWVNLSRILQMTLIDAQDGYASCRSRLLQPFVRGSLVEPLRPVGSLWGAP
jgi:hypothetical protein